MRYLFYFLAVICAVFTFKANDELKFENSVNKSGDHHLRDKLEEEIVLGLVGTVLSGGIGWILTPATKVCTSCSERIKSAATKCKHCGSTV